MTSVLIVLGALLATAVALSAVGHHPGAGDAVLRTLGGGALVAMGVLAFAGGAPEAGVIALAAGVPLVAGPALPWAIAAVRHVTGGAGRARRGAATGGS